MKLFEREEISLEKVDAFKLFKLVDNKLTSSISGKISYEVNKRISPYINDTFFAYKNYDDLLCFVKDRKEIPDLIILPVTLYNVVASGVYPVCYNDEENMVMNFSYYTVYEAKEMIVHYSQENIDIFKSDYNYNDVCLTSK